MAGTTEALRTLCAELYAGWQQVLAGRPEGEGLDPGRAGTAAGQVLALLEGAVLLASVRRGREPLDHARHAVRHLLGAAQDHAGTA